MGTQKQLLIDLINRDNKLKQPITEESVKFTDVLTLDAKNGTSSIKMTALETNEHYKGTVTLTYTRLPITKITGVEVSFGETLENTVDPLYPEGHKVDPSNEETIKVARVKFIEILEKKLEEFKLSHALAQMDFSLQEVVTRAKPGQFGQLCKIEITVAEDNLVFLPGTYEILISGVSKETPQKGDEEAPKDPNEGEEDPKDERVDITTETTLDVFYQ